MKLKRSIHEQLLVCIRTTIDLRGKQLFVSYANNYSFVPQTTIEPDANDYYSPPTSSRSMIYTPSLKQGKPCEKEVLPPAE